MQADHEQTRTPSVAGGMNKLQSRGTLFAALTLLMAALAASAPAQRLAIPVLIATGVCQLISIVSFIASTRKP